MSQSPWSRAHKFGSPCTRRRPPMGVPGHVAVDDVESGPALQLGVLETLGRIQLAVGAGSAVEDPGQGADHVLVVVEDLVVVPGPAVMTTHEDRIRRVHHDLPHVVVREEGLEGI